MVGEGVPPGRARSEPPRLTKGPTFDPTRSPVRGDLHHRPRRQSPRPTRGRGRRARGGRGARGAPPAGVRQHGAAASPRSGWGEGRRVPAPRQISAAANVSKWPFSGDRARAMTHRPGTTRSAVGGRARQARAGGVDPTVGCGQPVDRRPDVLHRHRSPGCACPGTSPWRVGAGASPSCPMRWSPPAYSASRTRWRRRSRGWGCSGRRRSGRRRPRRRCRPPAGRRVW